MSGHVDREPPDTEASSTAAQHPHQVQAFGWTPVASSGPSACAPGRPRLRPHRQRSAQRDKAHAQKHLAHALDPRTLPKSGISIPMAGTAASQIGTCRDRSAGKSRSSMEVGGTGGGRRPLIGTHAGHLMRPTGGGKTHVVETHGLIRGGGMGSWSRECACAGGGLVGAFRLYSINGLLPIQVLGEVSSLAFGRSGVGEVDPLRDPGHHVVEALTRPPHRLE
jgi:hypothetical protein